MLDLFSCSVRIGAICKTSDGLVFSVSSYSIGLGFGMFVCRWSDPHRKLSRMQHHNSGQEWIVAFAMWRGSPRFGDFCGQSGNEKSRSFSDDEKAILVHEFCAENSSFGAEAGAGIHCSSRGGATYEYETALVELC